MFRSSQIVQGLLLPVYESNYIGFQCKVRNNRRTMTVTMTLKVSQYRKGPIIVGQLLIYCGQSLAKTSNLVF